MLFSPAFWLSFCVQTLLRGMGWLLLLLLVTALFQRRLAAAGRAAVWQTGFVGLLLLPLLLLFLPPLPLLPPMSPIRATSPLSTPTPDFPVAATHTPVPDAPTPFPAEAPRDTQAAAAAAQGRSALAPVPLSPSAAPPMGNPLLSRIPWQELTLIVWGLGALGLMTRLGIGLTKLQWLGQEANLLPAELDAIAAASARTLQLNRSVTLRIAASATPLNAPITWGLRRPIILLPTEYTAESPAHCRAALLHEMAHVRRCDWSWLVLMQSLCALYWCVPFVWMAARRLTLEMELACDDCVLAAGVSAPDYAAQILEVVRKMQSETVRPHTQAMPMARLPLAEARIRAILDMSRPRRPSSRATLLAAALLPTLCLPILSVRHVAASEAHPASAPILPVTSPIPTVPTSSDLAAAPPVESPLPAIHKSASQPSLPVRRLAASASEPPIARLTIAPYAPHSRSAAPPGQGMRVIVWGPVINGLQAGMRILGEKRAFAPGEPIWQEIYLRNQSKEAVTIQTVDGYESQGDPVINDGKGARIKVMRFFGGGAYLPIHTSVQPGEIAQVGRVAVAFHAPDPGEDAPHEVAPGLSSAAEETAVAVAGAGAYTLAQELAPIGADGKPLPQHLRTGSLALQIQNVPAAPERGLDRNAIQDLATAPIAWGQVRSGLQVGLLLLNAKQEYFSGERVRAAVVLRNVSQTSIKFRHQASFLFMEAPQVTGADGKREPIPLAPEREWKQIHRIKMTGVTFDMTFAPSADGPSSLRESEIAPGQSVLGYGLVGMIVPARRQGGQAISGRYLLAQPFRIGLGQDDALNTLLETGGIPLTFSDPDAKENRSNRL